MTTRIGGFCVSITRIWTVLVWVRRSDGAERCTDAESCAAARAVARSSALEVEIVQRVARRVAFGDVQRDEVVELVLDLRAGGDGEAHAAEQLGQLVDDLHEDVAVADLRAAGRAR